MNDKIRIRLGAGLTLVASLGTFAQGQTQSPFRNPFSRGKSEATTAPATPPVTTRTTPATPAGVTTGSRTVDPAVKTASAAGANAKSAQAKEPLRDSQARLTNGVLPDLTPVEQLGQPIQLPSEPVEPYLLTKENGPFMVMAHTFRGPDSVKYAQALAMELRAVHRLPAYIYFKKIKPMNSNVRGVPPTSAPSDGDGRISEPEIYRIYDEAVVLVGDAPTLKDAESLLKVVKKIKPALLDNVPSIFPWRTGAGLKKAIVTANPLIPAQQLFARESDPLVDRMNRGPHTLYNCPGPYTLVVARFTGRSTFGGEGDSDFLKDSLKTSPLATATDEAELMAAELNKDPMLKKAGMEAYVYHDRKKSVVTLGHFNEKIEAEDMPKNQKILSIRQHLDKLSQQYMNSGKFQTPLTPTDVMPVPQKTQQQKAKNGLFQ
jgi:hypothetical protein